MQKFTFRLFSILLPFVLLLISTAGNAQSTTIFDPNDPIVTYNPSNPPTQPISGPGKWVRTSRLTWNTSLYKCYIYKGIAFRLRYPKTYVPGNGKKYPLFLFLHGSGERGTIYDNEYQLYLGGQNHNDAVSSGKFDGFLLYPQTSATSGIFNTTDLGYILELIENYLIPEVQVDPFRISVNGLSAGGFGTWKVFLLKPKLFASVLPISNASETFAAQIDANKFTRIWLFQGGLDNSPVPYYGRYLRNYATGIGANFTYTEYPTRGHDCWYQAWGEANYFPYISAAHKANPWPLNGKTEFCPQETINQVIGVTAGFDGYEWRKNGELIPGANTNTITATSLGVYDCRILRGTDWSPWSPIPVELKIRTTFTSPTPEMVEFASKVVPSPDGKTTVQLKVPEGATSYTWTKQGEGTVGNNNIYTAGAGTYQVTVVLDAACPSTPSLPFTVINANGPNKPEAVRSLIVNKISQTSLKLNWVINPGASNPPTNFEIYQATQRGGPYQFAGITDATVKTFTKVNLTPGTRYYYVVRAVNNTAGSDLSAEVSETTESDVTPPTAPYNLTVTGTTRTSIALQWEEAADDAGIAAYDIYINGVKTYTAFATSYIVSNLTYNNLYTITVKARDVAGNQSPFSNQVSARTVSKGLTYKYYTGVWGNLPDFTNTLIQASGFVNNVDLSKKLQETQFGFLWEGYITIPVSGNYTFQLSSADGSKLYFNNQYGYATPATIDNGGTHDVVTKNSSTTYVTAGVYPIAITYFQATKPPVMNLLWKNPQTSNNFVKIPDSAFVESSPAPAGLPSAPGSLAATAISYNKVAITWADNSNNETAFELQRSTDPDNGFAVISTLPANTTSYQDTTVSAATKYYYRIRAINSNGESKYDKFGRGVDYYYYNTPKGLTQIPDFNSLTLVKTGRIPNFSLGMQDNNDYFAFKYESYINITSAGTYKFYTSSDDGSRLYIDGNLVVNNDGAHSTSEKSGSVVLQPGIHSITVTYFEIAGDEVLTVSYEKTSSGAPSIAKQIIPITVLGEEYINVTTAAAPPAPATPYDLRTTGVTKSSVKLAWSNDDASVIKYRVYRSFENNTDYVLYATTTGNYYTDTALFPNSTVYYKVKSVSATGVSNFSEELNVITLGDTPVLDPIPTQYMRYGTQLVVQLNATITTLENISLSVTGLPSFATFASSGNGKGTITFNNPLQSQQGTYTNIVVTASSAKGNAVSRNFSLIVNDNNIPVVTGESEITVGVGQTRQAVFTATDADAGDNITWTYQGLPNFVAVSNNSNARTSTLTISPLIGSSGTYNVTAKADDGRNGTQIMAFVINVTASNQIYIHFGPSSNNIAPAPWNSIGKLLAENEVYPAASGSGFKDKNGVSTNVRIKPDKATEASYNGVSTGSNSGVYPDLVLTSGYRVNIYKPTNFTVTGLDKNKKYSFTFFASFIVSTSNFSARYAIGTASVVLNPYNNTQNVVVINNVQPNNNGEVIFNVNLAPGNNAYYTYINSVVITEGASGAQEAPSRVSNFQIKFEDNAAKLTWVNTATNATGYEIYRANSIMGPYTLLNPGANDPAAQSYSDNTIKGNKTYYYIVRAKNDAGGNNSANQKIDIPNRAPAIMTTEAFCKTEQSTTVNVTATDDPGETITLKTTDLPSFVTFTDNGNGTGNLNVSPAAGNKGVFDIKITATDNFGASNLAIIKLYVTDKNISSIYVNFNSTIPVAGIWNSFNKAPAQGAFIANLKNDMNTATSVKVELLDAWAGASNNGTITGSNTGAFRDDVLKTFYSETGSAPRRVRISGLSTDPNVRYNLVFLGNASGSNASTTIYNVSGQSDSLNVTNNTGKTVQINGIAANGGVIEYNVVKSITATAAYMNALVIQSYMTSTTLLSPDNVKAIGIAQDSVRLTWNNRVAGGNVEVYRSNSANGMFTRIATVSTNTYTDRGLLANTEYFYKLKAVNTPNVSNFSNTVSAFTYAYSVYINFNFEDPAAAPWNNTNLYPIADYAYNYFVKSDNSPSGINMIVGDGFSGTNLLGENTGNNSGIVPDNVMQSSWWVGVGQQAKLKFSGLSQNKMYRFSFFASNKGVSPVMVTTYTINNTMVKLKFSGNRTDMVSIDNVYPDQNGEVVITLRGEGNYAYIGGIIIGAVNVPSIPVDGVPGMVFRQQDSTQSLGGQRNITSADSTIISSDVRVYPNPFSSDVALKLSLNSGIQKLNIKVADITGRVVFVREIRDIKAGTTVHPLGLDKLKLQGGIYVISVYNDSGYLAPPIKVVKEK